MLIELPRLSMNCSNASVTLQPFEGERPTDEPVTLVRTLEYRSAIDGLRALAVLSVLTFHLNHQWLPGGFVGVDIFFVISGYLITSIIYNQCRNDSFSLSRFYQRRIARIFPVFFVVGSVTLAGAFLIYSPQDLAWTGRRLVWAALSLTNIQYMLRGDYFETPSDSHPYLHYWSLSVEEQFYAIFPLIFLLVFRHARAKLALVLSVCCGASFLLSVLTTFLKPDWAFYLLPTRAWELGAGCLLAVTTDRSTVSRTARWANFVSISGIGLIALSLLVIREGTQFPGFWALLPTLGAVGVLAPISRSAIGEKMLSASFLVLVGRMSYSLYVWHWPIFSLIDYKMCFSPDSLRVALKVGLTGVASSLSFFLIENPARSLLNQRKRILLTYSSMLCAAALCGLLGNTVSRSYYVNATPKDITKGGLVFESQRAARSVILMGDSNGSMYGKVMQEVCAELGCRLTVLSVASFDPLPGGKDASDKLWLDCLRIVRNTKPDYLVLACLWTLRFREGRERLDIAVETLNPLVGHLVILNQPPFLPECATRAAIRRGSRPPFYEANELRGLRIEANQYLLRFKTEKCSVVDIASYFEEANGELLTLDSQGRQMFADTLHLSGFGADSIRSELKHALSTASSDASKAR